MTEVDFFATVSATVGEYIALDSVLVQLAGLLLLAVAAHIALGIIVRRLHHLALSSAQAWDDVLISAMETPVRVVLWFAVINLAMQLYPATDGLQAQLAQAYDTALVMVLTWFLLRLIGGVEAELLNEGRAQGASRDRAAVHASAKLARTTVWIIAGLMVLQTVGVSISGLLAFGGIGGIAVG
ncbi:MAG: mechanosensitive ion channel family protein, partial [Halieaceae bacterium]|nr:mechanosensitive ion channel family protein [Halieaceae bacterium]